MFNSNEPLGRFDKLILAAAVVVLLCGYAGMFLLGYALGYLNHLS